MREDKMKSVELKSFTSHDNTEKYRSSVKRSYRSSHENHNFTSASVKIGLCIAVCIALCIINLTVDTSSSMFASNYENDDTPGKLRFVELPGIIEVFAGGDEFTMPVGEYEGATLNTDTNILEIKAKSSATVVTCGSGTVKAIGKDDSLGSFVVIRHGDIETYYYGFACITVEERQVINKLDTLGLLTQSGVMYFKIQEGGKALNPCDHLPVKIDK